MVAFQTRNRPPAIRIRSRQEKPWPKAVNTGSVSCTMNEIVASSTSRMIKRRADAEPAGARLLLLRQLVGQDRDEDQIVDAEHDLEHDQRQQRTQAGSVCRRSRNRRLAHSMGVVPEASGSDGIRGACTT